MIRKLLTAILLFLFTASIAGAVDINGVKLPDTVIVEGEQLVLNGAGVREKKILIIEADIYVAGLYLKDKTSDAQAIIDADETMMLRLKIVSGLLSSEKFKKSTIEGFKESTGGNTAPIQREIDMFTQAFETEVNKGDVVDIQYVKDKGVLVYKNNKSEPEVIITGLPIKKALFGIWLGHRTEAKLQALAASLLGK